LRPRPVSLIELELFGLARARFSFRIEPSNGDGVPQNRRIG
jgi:hypothetical protein